MINDLRKSVLHDEVFVVVFPHWGGRRNYGWRTNSQRKMGHQLIEAGADLVIGHGPHNLQEIEEYEGRLIFYSIGNFVYNSLGGYNRYNVIPYSLAVKLMFSVEGIIPGELSSSHHTVGATSTGLKKLVKVYPILTENPRTNFQPRLLNENEFDIVYKALIDKASDFDSKKTRSRAGIDEIGRHIELSLN